MATLLHQWWQDLQRGSFFHLCVFSVFLHYLLQYLLRLILSPKRKLPPSPLGLPIVGHLHKLGELPHRSFLALSRKCGPLMLLQLGNVPTLIVSSPEMAKEIMTTQDAVFANRPRLRAVDLFFYGCTGVGFSTYGEYFLHVKQICFPELLRLQKLHSFQLAREEEVAELIRSIRDACPDGSAINLSNIFADIAGDIISRSVIGRKFEREDGGERVGELARKVTDLCGAFCFADYFPSLEWVDDVTKFSAKLKRTFQALDAFLDQVVEDHYVSVCIDNQTDVKDFADALLHLHKEGQIGIELTQDNLKAILLDMLTAGTDATSTTMEWAMAELVKNPDSMKKAQEEVRTVVGKKSKIGDDDINQMEYLKCVVKETLRLHPPPFLLPRESSTSAKVGGFDVPPKTRVLINAWAIQRDPKLWDNPEEFLPERFISNPVDFRSDVFCYIPFGAGSRGCPGFSYAVTLVEFVLANLLYWFDWKLTEGTSPLELDMSEIYGQCLSKKIPLHLIPVLHS